MSDLIADGIEGARRSDRALAVPAEPASGLDPSGFDPSRGLFGDTVRKDALVSECGVFRYWLTREWDESRPNLPIIMLNPSTADAAIDDPTIRRCISFAKRDGYGGIRVMNLFAFRATSPKEMLAQRNPFGPDNWAHLLTLIVYARANNVPILCAWGAHGVHGMAKRVQEYAKVNRVRLVCLGKTGGGHPRHPLYVKGDQAFEALCRDSDGSASAARPGTGLDAKDDSAGLKGIAETQVGDHLKERG